MEENNSNAAEQPSEQNNSDGSYGKFKDLKSLLKAYTGLEAEFTRRNQRFKSGAGDGISEKEKTDNSVPDSPPSGEKDKQTATEEFFKKYPSANSVAGEILRGGSDLNQSLEQAYITVLEKQIADKSRLTADEDFLNTYIYSSGKIRDKIVMDYLKSVIDLKPAAKIFGGGAGASVAAPPYKPKTLEEASALAKQYITKK